MKFSSRSILTSTLSLVFVVSLLAPLTASAWSDAPALGQRFTSIGGMIKGLILGKSGYMKEYVLDPVQKVIATKVQQALISSTLKWAEQGFNGQPAFVRNPRDFVGQIALQEADNLINQINSNINKICKPFQGMITINIAKKRQQNNESEAHSVGELTRLTECNLDKLVAGGEIENYYAAGGYEQNGLTPLLHTNLNRKNNPYELQKITEDLLGAREKKAATEAQSQTAGGTLPTTRCVKFGPLPPGSPPGAKAPCEKTVVDVPASNVSDLVSKSVLHSLDEIAGEDELKEGFVSQLVRAFTVGFLKRNLGYTEPPAAAGASPIWLAEDPRDGKAYGPYANEDLCRTAMEPIILYNVTNGFQPPLCYAK